MDELKLIKLIALVKQSVYLWKVPLYHRNETVSDSLWEEIAECVGENANLCRSEWSRLRHVYNVKKKEILKRKQRLKKTEICDDNGNNETDWPFVQHLKFLDEIMDPKNPYQNSNKNNEIDKLKLIAEVKERPYLWKIRLKAKDTLVWNYLWTEVAACVGASEEKCRKEWFALNWLYMEEKEHPNEEVTMKNIKVNRDERKYLRHLKFLDDANVENISEEEVQSSDFKVLRKTIADEVQLITEVQKRQYLWKYGKNGNRKLYNFFWMEIAEVMHSDVKTVKRKWKRLRRKYKNKFLNSNASEGSTNEWTYYGPLKFINTVYDIPQDAFNPHNIFSEYESCDDDSDVEIIDSCNDKQIESKRMNFYKNQIFNKKHAVSSVPRDMMREKSITNQRDFCENKFSNLEGVCVKIEPDIEFFKDSLNASNVDVKVEPSFLDEAKSFVDNVIKIEGSDERSQDEIPQPSCSKSSNRSITTFSRNKSKEGSNLQNPQLQQEDHISLEDKPVKDIVNKTEDSDEFLQEESYPCVAQQKSQLENTVEQVSIKAIRKNNIKEGSNPYTIEPQNYQRQRVHHPPVEAKSDIVIKIEDSAESLKYEISQPSSNKKSAFKLFTNTILRKNDIKDKCESIQEEISKSSFSTTALGSLTGTALNQNENKGESTSYSLQPEIQLPNRIERNENKEKEESQPRIQPQNCELKQVDHTRNNVVIMEDSDEILQDEILQSLYSKENLTSVTGTDLNSSERKEVSRPDQLQHMANPDLEGKPESDIEIEVEIEDSDESLQDEILPSLYSKENLTSFTRTDLNRNEKKAESRPSTMQPQIHQLYFMVNPVFEANPVIELEEGDEILHHDIPQMSFSKSTFRPSTGTALNRKEPKGGSLICASQPIHHQNTVDRFIDKALTRNERKKMPHSCSIQKLKPQLQHLNLQSKDCDENLKEEIPHPSTGSALHRNEEKERSLLHAIQSKISKKDTVIRLIKRAVNQNERKEGCLPCTTQPKSQPQAKEERRGNLMITEDSNESLEDELSLSSFSDESLQDELPISSFSKETFGASTYAAVNRTERKEVSQPCAIQSKIPHPNKVGRLLDKTLITNDRKKGSHPYTIQPQNCQIEQVHHSRVGGKLLNHNLVILEDSDESLEDELPLSLLRKSIFRSLSDKGLSRKERKEGSHPCTTFEPKIQLQSTNRQRVTKEPDIKLSSCQMNRAASKDDKPSAENVLWGEVAEILDTDVTTVANIWKRLRQLYQNQNSKPNEAERDTKDHLKFLHNALDITKDENVPLHDFDGNVPNSSDSESCDEKEEKKRIDEMEIILINENPSSTLTFQIREKNLEEQTELCKNKENAPDKYELQQIGDCVTIESVCVKEEPLIHSYSLPNLQRKNVDNLSSEIESEVFQQNNSTKDNDDISGTELLSKSSYRPIRILNKNAIKARRPYQVNQLKNKYNIPSRENVQVNSDIKESSVSENEKCLREKSPSSNWVKNSENFKIKLPIKPASNIEKTSPATQNLNASSSSSMENKINENYENIHNDSDYSFLVDCLPTVKIMNQSQKIQFRERVEKLILNILIPSSSNDDKHAEAKSN